MQTTPLVWESRVQCSVLFNYYLPKTFFTTIRPPCDPKAVAKPTSLAAGMYATCSSRAPQQFASCPCMRRGNKGRWGGRTSFASAAAEQQRPNAISPFPILCANSRPPAWKGCYQRPNCSFFSSGRLRRESQYIVSLQAGPLPNRDVIDFSWRLTAGNGMTNPGWLGGAPGDF